MGGFFLAEPGIFAMLYRVPFTSWTDNAQSAADGVNIAPHWKANHSIRYWQYSDGERWRYEAIKLLRQGCLLHFCRLVGWIHLGRNWVLLLPGDFSHASWLNHA